MSLTPIASWPWRFSSLCHVLPFPATPPRVTWWYASCRLQSRSASRLLRIVQLFDGTAVAAPLVSGRQRPCGLSSAIRLGHHHPRSRCHVGRSVAAVGALVHAGRRFSEEALDTSTEVNLKSVEFMDDACFVLRQPRCHRERAIPLDLQAIFVGFAHGCAVLVTDGPVVSKRHGQDLFTGEERMFAAKPAWVKVKIRALRKLKNAEV